MKICKKTWPKEFQAVADGDKTFDVRLADFSCKKGDIMLLQEFDPKTGTYSGREVQKKITYVAKLSDFKFWSKEDVKKYGLQIIAIK